MENVCGGPYWAVYRLSESSMYVSAFFLTSELAAFALKPRAGVMNKDMCEPDV